MIVTSFFFLYSPKIYQNSTFPSLLPHPLFLLFFSFHNFPLSPSLLFHVTPTPHQSLYINQLIFQHQVHCFITIHLYHLYQFLYFSFQLARTYHLSIWSTLSSSQTSLHATSTLYTTLTLLLHFLCFCFFQLQHHSSMLALSFQFPLPSDKV